LELTVEAPGLQIDFAGGPLRLRPDGSAHSGQALFVADLHLGKDAVFRSEGIAVPAGPSAGTLVRLTDALLETEAQSLVLLGDLWHAEVGLNEDLLSDLIKWRARHADLKIWFVRGNHDRGGNRMLDLLEVQEVDAGSRFGAISLFHHPPADLEGWLAGHIHPTYVLKAGRRSERVSCFWATAGGLVLPAFGEFTGTAPVDPLPGDRIYAIAGPKVMQIPLSGARKRG
jgi:DNA ligase-associated metallophosphoesterase